MTVTLIAEILVFAFSDKSSLIALSVLVVTALLTLIAVVASHLLHVKKVELSSIKLKNPHNIVQISDVHIGSRQGGFMRRIVNKINSLSPDSVVITGDLIDSSAVEIDALKPLAEIAAPTYFVIGNHERYADLPKILQILNELEVQVLRQASIIQGDIQFVGIDDADRRDQVNNKLPETPISEGLFNVLLYHRPVGWAAARQAGMDLMLSGHTHNGQIFPFNFLVKQQFDRIKGLYQNEGASLYVSSGTGTWGPLMRLGTSNEITLIHLRPGR